MQQIFPVLRGIVLAAVVAIVCAATTTAQTTAFTYQGRFTDTSVPTPTNGSYNMTFRLFDAASGGNQIPNGSTEISSLVSVSSGIFTVRLDFGAAAFNPALTASSARYLEIQVGSTVLTPRQEITSAPFSNRAVNAASADALSAACVGCVTDANLATGIDGAKIAGTVANANTATTAGNVTGVVQIANGGTGDSTQNFVDLYTNQTVNGNKNFSGTLSGNGSGLTNVAKFTNFNGAPPLSIAGGASAYIFLLSGSTPTVTVTAGQRITASGSATLGTTGNVAVAQFNFCYQPAAGGTISDLGPSNYHTIEVGQTRITYAVSNSFVLAAGSYKVGLCIENYGSIAINRNGYVTGWIMVTNN